MQIISDIYNRSDLTDAFHINSLNENPYISTGLRFTPQVYGIVQLVQRSTFTFATTVQMGKIKSEHRIQDSKMKRIAFSKDGKWMANMDRYNFSRHRTSVISVR